MGALISYLVESSVYLFGFVLINKLLLERETFHKINRIIWLLIIFISITIPLLFVLNVKSGGLDLIGLDMSGKEAAPLQQLPILKENNYIGKVLFISLALYLIGALFYTVRMLIAYYQLYRVLKGVNNYRDSELLIDCMRIAGIKRQIYLKITTNSAHPFSWMNYIVISKEDYDSSGREILLHELSHIKSRHTLDLIFIDLLTIFFWFNPAIWIAKRELMQVHEYSADESVIKSGIVNIEQYQLLLIKKAVGKSLYSMANSFNHSKLKSRVTMMLKTRSNRWSFVKCLYVLPLILLTTALFATPVVSKKIDDISRAKIEYQAFGSDHIYHMAEIFTPPEFIGEAFQSWVYSELVYPEIAKEGGIDGRVTASFIIEKDGSLSNVEIMKGVHESLDNEVFRVLNKSPKWRPGRLKNGSTARVIYTFPIIFQLK